jgi:hypothetical protein
VVDAGSVGQRGWWACGVLLGGAVLFGMLDPENEVIVIFEKVRNYTPT